MDEELFTAVSAKLSGFESLDGVIRDGIKKRLHTAAGVAVFHRGEVLLNRFVCGEPESGLDESSPMLWMSAGKPLTATAVLQLVSAGTISLRQPVAQILPEFGRMGKEAVTVEHLLTHVGGFRGADLLIRDLDLADALAAVCDSRLEPGWEPGKKAGYHLNSSWIVLAGMIEAVTGMAFAEYMQSRLLTPAGMTGTRVVKSPNSDGQDVPVLDTATPPPAPHARFNGDIFKTRVRPGSNTWGPAVDLARFYDALLNRPSAIGLSSEMRDRMVSRVRSGMQDATFKAVMDWGLGVIVNNWHRGQESIPYGFGAYASKNTYGHGGSQSSVGFADPEHHIAAAIVFNGMPGDAVHQVRIREACEALYQDLGFAV